MAVGARRSNVGASRRSGTTRVRRPFSASCHELDGEDTRMVTREGGCSCGAVRYQVTGEPIMVGICHCTSCRKATGSVFMAYADWPPEAFVTTGEVRTFDGRTFCPNCGSRLYQLSEDHVEIKI